jgi:hypothetical protein
MEAVYSTVVQEIDLVSDISTAKMAASYTFEDLSGATSAVSDNPYDGLIEACHDNSASSYRSSQYFVV